ncbi:MAG: NAD(P)(+) transhydrogenase (Re/Si-specific) subunit beta, partial [Actinobacteria bacterium]|nr:NAD(P)(+) transhydrogenase (Re/Si-specific) subunit beta [Actinomycetota bacterium]
PNTLYDNEKAILLFGDAKQTVGELLSGLEAAPAAPAAPALADG